MKYSAGSVPSNLTIFTPMESSVADMKGILMEDLVASFMRLTRKYTQCHLIQTDKVLHLNMVNKTIMSMRNQMNHTHKIL